MIKEFDELEKYIESDHAFDDVVDLFSSFFGGIIVNCYNGKSGKFMTLVHSRFPDTFSTNEAGGYIMVTPDKNYKNK